ncbi:MAG: cyclic nucleotide-binding domain-containing protein [Candidatus Omnitrophica bacterium]|nr:cyclic nucleotide-binding domain-containing protein [Candidatus Omnitrophota bacterium]
MEKIKDLLMQHPFFKGLPKERLDLLAGCGSNIHFKKGECIFKMGEESNHFYIVRKGRVSLEMDGAQHGPIRVQTIEEGDILGWSWLIPPHKWSFTAFAVEDVNVTALDGQCLRRKCEEDHDLGYELLKRFSAVLAKRLEWTRMQLLDVYGANA